MKAMDLKDDETKHIFSLFINLKKRQLGTTDAELAHKLGVEIKMVDHYMGMHLGGERWKPARIPDNTYRDFLTVLKASHADFEEFFIQKVQEAKQETSTNVPAQSLGSGAVHIGSIKIDSGATLNQSPIGAQTVNYGTINN